jgi:hypothetical protein
MAAISGDPRLWSKHLRRRVAAGDVPGAVTLDGAVLLSDVVGFTSHVEAMSAVGSRGLEDFTSAIGYYIDQLVSLVIDEGGDVLCIAGDSLLCLWEAKDDSEEALRSASVSAALTGLRIQESTHDHPIADGRTLRTRIGLAAGPLTLTVAGGVGDNWELLAHGETLERVDAAERLCEPGCVTLDTSAANLLVGHAAMLPVRDGLHQIDQWFERIPDRPVGRTDRHGVSGRASVSSDLWTVEFRRLSIVMIRVAELRQAAADVAQEVVREFQTIVGRYEGLSSAVIDNKGVRLLATFGSSGLSHEDDAVRAIGAAHAFRASMDRHGFVCSAGIATGKALQGVTGNEHRQSPTFAGDVINVAARLSTTAIGEVLCDQETAVAARDQYSFAVMNPIRVKGKSEPVTVFEPREVIRGRHRRTDVLRGRAEELAVLTDVLDGRLDVVVLSGEAGVGKSALVGKLAAVAEDRGVPTRIATTDAIDRSTPFRAWQPILHEILGTQPAAGVGDPASYIEPAKALVSDDLVPYVAVLSGLLGGSTAGSAVVADEQRASIIPRLVADIVVAGGHRPLILFEDAHWADSASLEVLRVMLVAHDAPRVVLTTRPEGLPNLRRVMTDCDRRRTREVELGSLRADAVVDLIADRLAVERVPRELVDFVQHRVAGHPYFCEQLLRSLVENGTLRIEGGGVVIGELDPATVPSTVEGVIMGRFDLLDVDAQRCLKAASVVGRRHHVDAVQACLSDVDVHAVMQRVEAHGLVGPTRPKWFEFQHVITRDVVYAMMTEQQRRDLHALVATHLSELPHGPGPAAIGEHWSGAGEAIRAADCFTRAANDALNAGSFAECVALLDRVDELRRVNGLEAERSVRAGVALLRARASYYLGRLAECRAELESIIALFDIPMPTTEAAHRAEQSAIASMRDQPGTTPDSTTPDSTTPEETADVAIHTMLFETYRFLVKVLFLLAEAPLPIVTASLRGLVLADRLGRTLEGAAMESLVGGAYVLIGDAERYEHHTNAAIAVAESPAGAPVANHVWRMVAVARAGRGEWAGSLDASDRALAAMDPAGRNRDSGIWQTRAAVHLCAGDMQGARIAWEHTAEIAERDGNAQLARWSRLDEIQTLIGSGDVAAASALLNDTLMTTGRPTDPLGTIEQFYTIALVRSAEGRHVEAVQAARSVVSIIGEAPPSGFHFVEFCAGAIEVMVAAFSGDDTGRLTTPDFATEVTENIDLLERLVDRFPHVAPRVPLARALMASATGDAPSVEELIGSAIELSVDSNLAFDAACRSCRQNCVRDSRSTSTPSPTFVS